MWESVKLAVKLRNPKVTAKFIIEPKTGGASISLRAHSDIVTQKVFTPQDLLFAPNFNLTYNKFHLITCVI